MFAKTTLFSVVTLPVEFNATNRALKWLNTVNITTPQEHEGAIDALKWAALTYVVSALASMLCWYNIYLFICQDLMTINELYLLKF